MKTFSKSLAVLMTLVSLASAAVASTPDATAKMSGDYGASGVHRPFRHDRHDTAPAIHRTAQVESRRAFSPDIAPVTHHEASRPAANTVRTVPHVERHTMNYVGNHDGWALMTRDAGSKMSGNY